MRFGILIFLLVLSTALLRAHINRSADATMAEIEALYVEHGVPMNLEVLAIEGDAQSMAFVESAPEIWGDFLPVMAFNDLATEPGPTQLWPSSQIAVARWSMTRNEEDWTRAIDQHEIGLELTSNPADPKLGLMRNCREWSYAYMQMAIVAAATDGFDAGVPWMIRSLELADAILEHPDLDFQLTGRNIPWMLAHWIEDELSRYDGSSEQLRLLADHLENSARHMDLRRSLAVELTRIYKSCPEISNTLDEQPTLLSPRIAIETKDLSTFEIVRSSWIDLDKLASSNALMAVRAHWLKARVIRYLAPRCFETQLLAPMKNAFSDFASLGADPTITDFGEPIGLATTDFFPVWLSENRLALDYIVVATAALRAEAMRIETGEWTDLDLGLDRYGNDLRSRELSDGWMVYTTGPDGVDQYGYWRLWQGHDPQQDTGIPDSFRELVENRERHRQEVEAWDDVSFRIYRPEARGKPATPWPPRIERSEFGGDHDEPRDFGDRW